MHHGILCGFLWCSDVRQSWSTWVWARILACFLDRIYHMLCGWFWSTLRSMWINLGAYIEYKQSWEGIFTRIATRIYKQKHTCKLCTFACWTWSRSYVMPAKGHTHKLGSRAHTHHHIHLCKLQVVLVFRYVAFVVCFAIDINARVAITIVAVVAVDSYVVRVVFATFTVSFDIFIIAALCRCTCLRAFAWRTKANIWHSLPYILPHKLRRFEFVEFEFL